MFEKNRADRRQKGDKPRTFRQQELFTKKTRESCTFHCVSNDKFFPFLVCEEDHRRTVLVEDVCEPTLQSPAPMMEPISWLTMYGMAMMGESPPARVTPRVTAGLMWPPLKNRNAFLSFLKQS